jgi:hypothetical protein
MRHFWLSAAVILGAASGASAQTSPRFVVGPVARVDKVSAEAGVTSVMPVFGLAASVRLSRTWGIEGEITQARGREFTHSYDGVSETFAPLNSTLAEKERLGVLARWRYGYRPGMGGSVAVTARAGLASRADIQFRLGLAARNYERSFDYTVLRIPEGIDPARLATFSFGDGTSSSPHQRLNTQRGGLLMGVAVPIKITRRLTVAPDVRYVYGGPARIGEKHRELSLGVRAGWGF